MNLFGRKSVHITEAIPAFITAQNSALEACWKNIETQLRSIFPAAGTMNLSGSVKLEYLGAMISVDSQAIDNIYPTQRDSILGFLGDMLEAVEKTKRLAEAFRAYRTSWSGAARADNRPWDEVAATFIERASLPFETTRMRDTVLMSPLQIASVGQLLIQSAPAWWKPFSVENKLKI